MVGNKGCAGASIARARRGFGPEQVQREYLDFKFQVIHPSGLLASLLQTIV